MQNKFHQFSLLLTLVFASFLVSCDKKTVEKTEPQYLTEWELANSYSKENFKLLLSEEFGDLLGTVSPLIQSGIEQYKITYRSTDLYGNPVFASGAIVIPEDSEGTEYAMASMQHGTLFNKDDAPSNFRVDTEATFGSFFASTNMVVGMPDYIGYGVSLASDHPYEHAQGLAKANADFIRAMKEFLDQKKIKWNGKLFLAGYSEGGYATLATHKYLEENLANEFPVTASACGAGAYNKTASFNTLINEESLGSASYNRSYLWVLDTYKKAYNLDLPNSYIFKEPYATRVEKDGYWAEIDISLNKAFTEKFINDYNSGRLIDLNDAIAANDIFDWKPKAIVKLYHGDKDNYVPFLNSQTAYDAMKQQGASVTLIKINDGTHTSSINTFLIGVLQLFITQ